MPSLRRLVALLLATTAVVAAALPSIDPDLFWHLGVGRAALAGEVIRVEPYSWAAVGRPFYPHSIAHDALLALLYDGGGLLAVALLGALLGALALLLLDRLAVTVGLRDPLARGALLFIAALLAGPVWSSRAQLWDLIGLLAVAILFEMHRRGARGRILLALPAIALAWTLLHGAGLLAGASVGLVYLVDALVARDRARVRALLLAALGAALAASVGPLGPSLLLYPFETLVSPVQQAAIAEWQPLTVELPSGALLVALLVASLLAGQRSDLPRPLTALAIAWGLLAAGSIRYLLLAGPLVALLLVPPLVTVIEARIRALLRRRGSLLVATLGMRRITLGASLLLACFAGVRLAGTDYAAALAAAYPVEGAKAIVARGCDGNTLNSYAFGGYLIEHTDLVVGHYGAADAMGDAALADYLDVINLHVDVAEYLDRHAIKVVVLPPDTLLEREIVKLGWPVLFAEPSAVVLVTPTGNCER